MELKDWVKAARAHAGMSGEKLGELLGRTKGNVSGWERGDHSPSFEQVVAISKATGYSMREILSAEDGQVPLITTVPHPGEAQPLSHQSATLLPPVKWEEAEMEGYQFPPVFMLAVNDDALAPKLRAGTVVVWSTQKEPKIGAPVLLKDREGKLFVRLMAEGDRPGHFRAEARIQGYRHLDSEEHGLTVLAAFDGRRGDYDEF